MTINTGSIYPLLRPGVMAVIGNYDSYADQWKDVFSTHMSNRSVEYEVEYKSLGIGQLKPQGSSVAQDTMAVRYQTSYLHDTYGLSFSITDEAMKDNLYESQFPQHLIALRNSLRAAKSQVAANVFNLGTSTLVGDGQPFFSNNHPLDDGSVISNMSNVALSEVGVQNAIVQIQQFKQLGGILTNTMPKKMIVGPANQFAASIILGSQYRTSVGSTGDNTYAGVNDINAVYNDSWLPGGYCVNNYITSPTFSAICTDAERGLIHYEREKLEPWNWVDNSTKDMWFAAKERYSFGVTNWRAAYAIGT